MSAFPWQEFDQTSGRLYAQHPGMTLRDYFAAQAMKAMVREYCEANGRCIGTDHLYSNLPQHAYRMADAMLAARAKAQR